MKPFTTVPQPKQYECPKGHKKTFTTNHYGPVRYVRCWKCKVAVDWKCNVKRPRSLSLPKEGHKLKLVS